MFRKPMDEGLRGTCRLSVAARSSHDAGGARQVLCTPCSVKPHKKFRLRRNILPKDDGGVGGWGWGGEGGGGGRPAHAVLQTLHRSAVLLPHDRRDGQG